MGMVLWQSCGGQLSILGHLGSDRRQKRFFIWTVLGPLGWVMRVLGQMQVGVGLWQS